MENKRFTLRFSPVAWAKMQMACKLDDNECGFYGITSEESIFEVEDLFLPAQVVSPKTVSFDDDSVSSYFDEYANRGYPPRRLTSVWMHRHPHIALSPSPTDEHSFNKIIGQQDVAIMVIFDAGAARAWLQINRVGRQELFHRIAIDCAVSYCRSFSFDASEFEKEFRTKVRVNPFWNCRSELNFFDDMPEPIAATSTNPTGGLLFCNYCLDHVGCSGTQKECEKCGKQFVLCEQCANCNDNHDYTLCFDCEVYHE